MFTRRESAYKKLYHVIDTLNRYVRHTSNDTYAILHTVISVEHSRLREYSSAVLPVHLVRDHES